MELFFGMNERRHWKYAAIAMMATVVALEGSGPLEARTCYVANSGNDNHTGSEAEPLGAIQKAARAEDGSFLLVYLPHGQPVRMHMDKISGKKAKARWYDPREGTWREIGVDANTGTREFVAPSQGARSDRVLVLDDVEKEGPGLGPL